MTTRSRPRVVSAGALVALGAALLAAAFTRTTPAPASGVAAQYMSAYNAMVERLPLPTTTGGFVSVEGTQQTVEAFRRALESISMPSSARSEARDLDAATARLLAAVTPLALTGLPQPGGVAPIIAAVSVLHDWYTAAAHLGHALGLSSTDSVPYPTVTPVPSCTTSDLEVDHSLVDAFFMPGDVGLRITIRSRRAMECRFTLNESVTLVDESGKPLAFPGNPFRWQAELSIPSNGTGVGVQWANWCGPAGHFSFKVVIDGLTTMLVPLGTRPTPPCSGIPGNPPVFAAFQ